MNKLFVLLISMIFVSLLYPMENNFDMEAAIPVGNMETKDSNQNILDTTSRKKLFAFLFCLEKLRIKNTCYQLPKELKGKIISYLPELFYYPGIITIVLPHMEEHELPKFIKKLPYDAMKGYIAEHAEKNNNMSDLMQQEIDKRDEEACAVRKLEIGDSLFTYLK